jgi:hypothetical protein
METGLSPAGAFLEKISSGGIGGAPLRQRLLEIQQLVFPDEVGDPEGGIPAFQNEVG